MNRRILAFVALAPFGLAQTPTPQISGVVNAGNFRQPASPGALISIFGNNLATGQSQAEAVPLPTVLLSTMVYVDGIAAPLTYVSPGQINAQVPYGTLTDTSASIQVQVDGVNSSNSPLTIVPLAPAIFTQPGTGVGPAAILNQNNTVNTSATPAQPGQTIQIFATGLGATIPAVATGAGGDAQPLGQTPSVTIGGQTATVTFAGAAPGFAGLDQVNAVVPAVSSEAQPLVISFPGAQSAANVTVAVSNGSVAAAAIQPAYFGMHLAPGFFKGTLPWPTIPFGAVRLLGDTVTWADVEPTQGTFNFTLLDAILAGGAAHGVTDFLNTLVKTPAWASSNTTDTTCSDPEGRLGGCYPPSDLNADGTGADQYWKDYVMAIVQHVCTPGPCKIQNWEIWNEPNAANFWKGTTPQLVRMTQDAYQIIKSISPNAIVTSPPPGGGGDPGSTAASFVRSFMQDGGSASIDVMGFHGYLNAAEVKADQAELLPTALAGLSPLANKVIWDTEGSWGLSTGLPDPDQEASFVARSYLLQASSVQRFYWYAYDYPGGTLFNPTTMKLLEPGIAYGQVYDWLVGATPSGACANNGSIYTCGFTRPGGYRALAVWDVSQTCNSGVCTTSSYQSPAGYAQYRDLTGKMTQSAPVQVGLKPILLENQNP